MKRILTRFSFVSLILLALIIFGAAAPSLATRYFDGIYANSAVVDGKEDTVQLRVQGYVTQTNPIFTIETSDGTDVFTISNNGTVSTSGPATNGNTTINGTLLVDGQADSNQVTLQGYVTQTNPILTVEQSDGTDVFTVSNAGNVSTSGSSVTGNSTVNGTLFLDGQADSNQVTIQGYVTQTSKLLTLEDSAGVDKLTVDANGLLIDSATTVTVTNGLIITPTTRLYILDAAAPLTITLSAACVDGQPLDLFGNDAITITIADTNIRTTDGGVVAFDQYDLVTWECVSAEWILKANSSNQ